MADPAPPPSSSPEWAALFYLCGHFNRPDDQDPFVAALEEIRQVGGSTSMSAAVYLDLESGAQRIALRAGEPNESEYIGAVNSGDPQTLEQFLLWAFDACPAKRYVLVMAGLGILDADSVVGRPPFDSGRMFAICDDRATNDAIELHELSASLKAMFPSEGSRRLVMLACDMYAMQFMEVAYELRGVLDLIIGLQPDAREITAPLPHWPYALCLKRWQEIVAAPVENAGPRWRTGIDAHGLVLAKETVGLLAKHYGTALTNQPPVTVSAIDLQSLVPLAQALDTFSVVYLQWLSNDVVWRAREKVVTAHAKVLERSWSYDLHDVANAIVGALKSASGEALVRWAAAAMPVMSYATLAQTLRVLGATARELSKSGEDAEVCRRLATEIATCRSAVDRLLAVASDQIDDPVPDHSVVDAAVRRLFVPASDPDGVREPAAWAAIVYAAQHRFTGVPARELADALDGIEAAKQLGRLAKRVADLTRGGEGDARPAIVALWPGTGQCGLSLYRPMDLDKLAESNYLHLRFSRELHWTALLTAVDLIKHHARMLWRLVESQLTAAPLDARYQLMRRLAGDRALTGRHAAQLSALSAPDALFLTIDVVDDRGPEGEGVDAASAAEDRDPNDPIATYCVRLSSLDRSTTVIERQNQVSRDRLKLVLAEIGAVGKEVNAPPARTLQRLARCGSLLGDDILYGISDQLGDIQASEERAIHLVLQMPRELMRYPWELLRDRHGWLIERFAIGRQVIADADSAPRWASTRRHGPLRLLVVAPQIPGRGAELPGVGALEGMHVAKCFERLQERLPGVIHASNFRKHVEQPVTIDEFRSLVRSRRYDIIHFAGHGRYDAKNPERSCWMFTDGPLYALELRNTLSNAEVRPWLIYGSACEGAMEGDLTHGYHDGVYGMASAALTQGVAAYVGPLWTISETDAKNMAAAFYEALLIRRTSLGEALALARRSVRDGESDLDELVTRATRVAEPFEEVPAAPLSAGWAGMVLYGDPTPTVLQRLSPSDTGTANRQASAGGRGRRRGRDDDGVEETG